MAQMCFREETADPNPRAEARHLRLEAAAELPDAQRAQAHG